MEKHEEKRCGTHERTAGNAEVNLSGKKSIRNPEEKGGSYIEGSSTE
jgi:hypothetical protein